MSGAPITEADLHAWVDGQLGAERGREIEAYLAERPEEGARLAAYRAQARELRALYDKTCKIWPERFGLKRFVN